MNADDAEQVLLFVRRNPSGNLTLVRRELEGRPYLAIVTEGLTPRGWHRSFVSIRVREVRALVEALEAFAAAEVKP